MKQCVYKYQDHLDLIEYLNSDTTIIEARSTAISTLIQIYSETKITEVNEITSELCIAFPEAVIIGASSAGGVICIFRSIPTTHFGIIRSLISR